MTSRSGETTPTLEARWWRAVRIVVPAVILALWFVSLFLPTATVGTSHPDDVLPGWLLLIMGPLGALGGQFSWFANLVLLPGLIASLVWRRMSIILLLALALMLVAAYLHAGSWNWFPATGGGTNTIAAFGPGYHLWRACLLAGAIWFATFAAKRLLGGYGRWAEGGEFD